MTYWSQEIILQLFLSSLRSLVHNSRWRIWATCIIFLEWKPTLLMAICICLRQNTSQTCYFTYNFKMQNLLILLFLSGGSLVVMMVIPCLMPQCLIALLVLFSISPLPIQIFHLPWTKYVSSCINPLAPIGWLSNYITLPEENPNSWFVLRTWCSFFSRILGCILWWWSRWQAFNWWLLYLPWWLSCFLEC